ncbi:LPS assembly lipoprotein LptE [Pedobacter insulae]|uniref:Lipopolysaccharide-assembly n=1 Tax=Pedobacter insulae TaxID=414048 RepID=A0A1I2T7T5_9SPHI|nr:LPS assembly lipoprotein LptE [Pedobacter insulae]SFG61043.1 Lipopolysaccharide-assembly [Pedobacter insulae]
MKNLLFACIVLILSSCSYKFNGASIPPELKTVEVPVFENLAPLVDPTLSNTLTEAFMTRIRTQSKLNISKNGAQAKFEGKITDYDIRPIAIQDNTKPVAGATRLTITVMVKYTTTVQGNSKPFEQSFTAFTDYQAGQPLAGAYQQSLNKKIIDQLTENIFNAAFAQW